MSDHRKAKWRGVRDLDETFDRAGPPRFDEGRTRVGEVRRLGVVRVGLADPRLDREDVPVRRAFAEAPCRVEFLDAIF
jgi:hypothetical protein